MTLVSGLRFSYVPHVIGHTWIMSRREEEEVVFSSISVFFAVLHRTSRNKVKPAGPCNMSLQCLPLTSWVTLGQSLHLLYLHLLTSKMGA